MSSTCRVRNRLRCGPFIQFFLFHAKIIFFSVQTRQKTCDDNEEEAIRIAQFTFTHTGGHRYLMCDTRHTTYYTLSVRRCQIDGKCIVSSVVPFSWYAVRAVPCVSSTFDTFAQWTVPVVLVSSAIHLLLWRVIAFIDIKRYRSYAIVPWNFDGVNWKSGLPALQIF